MSATASRYLGPGLWAAAIAAAVLLPQIFTSGVSQNLAVVALLFAVVASNWDLTLGYAGIFNFAHVAFFGIAGYVAAIATIHLGLPVWWDIVLAVAVIAMLAGVTAALALRLRGIYVALVTFAFVQLCVALIVSQKDWTGGAVGLVGVPDLQLGDVALGADPKNYVYLSAGLLLASTFFLRKLVASDFGLSLIALRDNEAYAVARGVSAMRQRVLAMVASSLFTAAAGAVYAHYLIVASPDVFSFSLTTLILSMTLLGGTATIFGPILGAIVLTVVTEQLAGFGVLRFMIIAVLIVLTLRFLPGGLWSVGTHWIGRKASNGRSKETGSLPQ
jgi:branched-chain amino acid transport system permease protein